MSDLVIAATISGLVGMLLGAAGAAFGGVKTLTGILTQVQVDHARLTAEMRTFHEELQRVRNDRHEQINQMFERLSEVTLKLIDFLNRVEPNARRA